jgi:uncharacterized membrane protein
MNNFSKLKLMVPGIAFPIATAMSLLYQQPGYAELNFCNNYHEAISVAIAYDQGDFQRVTFNRGDNITRKHDNYIVRGWWRIEPGHCATPIGQDISPLWGVHYYAHSAVSGATWAGNSRFCVTNEEMSSLPAINSDLYGCGEDVLRTRRLDLNFQYYPVGFKRINLNRSHSSFTMRLGD